MAKNLQKVESMLQGEYGKTQVGYTPERVDRKLGDIWTDAEGIKWEQKKGYKIKITKTANKGIASKCERCEKLILKSFDNDTYNRYERCYHCQIDFELDLKREGKWEDWVMEQETERWESFLAEVKEGQSENQKINPFDETVANAKANENLKDYNENR